MLFINFYSTKGLDGPGCREVHCVIDNRIGCVPVYVSGVCCPIGYKCRKYIHWFKCCYKIHLTFLAFRLVTAEELELNQTRIIRSDPQPEGATTLPISISDLNEPKVKPDFCYLPKEVGICRMSMPSFFYDSERNECFSFTYGGCHVNWCSFDSLFSLTKHNPSSITGQCQSFLNNRRLSISLSQQWK